MEEYLRDSALLIPDITRCTIPVRDDGNQEYPLLRGRLQRLKLTWLSYEDIFERAFGLRNLDILTPEGHGALAGHIQNLAVRLAQEPAPLSHVQTAGATPCLRSYDAVARRPCHYHSVGGPFARHYSEWGRARIQSSMPSMTGPHSLMSRCRNSVALGYRRVSCPSPPHRQSGSKGRAIAIALPIAPARCATDVSTETTSCSLSMAAAAAV